MTSGTASRWIVSIAAVVVIIVGGIAAVACAPATPPPPTATPIPPPPVPPSNLDLTVEPGTTKVSATWDEVAGAAAYEVRWRSRREDFPTGNLATVTGPTAIFDVREQGLWLIRVQACNDSGCGGPGTATVPVIINISGHEAVRLWFDFDPEADSDEISAVHLDWDALPGYYIVKYRLTNNNNWITSEPLSEPGYTFTADSFATFEKRGQPIVRVFFNCDKDGRSCALLGRSPNTTMEKIWSRIPVDPYAAGGMEFREHPPPAGPICLPDRKQTRLRICCGRLPILPSPTKFAMVLLIAVSPARPKTLGRKVYLAPGMMP